jgi:hypothetical protein
MNPRDRLTPINYSSDGGAEVAECAYKERRLIIRRTLLIGRQATLEVELAIWRRGGTETREVSPVGMVHAASVQWRPRPCLLVDQGLASKAQRAL